MPQPCEFSETTYSFCFVHELLETWGVVGPPLMPNTYQEGQAGGGYDAEVEFEFESGGLVFVQFKIPEAMTHWSSGEWAALGNVPYLRVSLPKRRTGKPQSQHEMLRDLEDQREDSMVMYAFPRFSTVDGLNLAYAEKAIYDDSFHPCPSDLGDLEPDEPHTVSYCAAGTAYVVKSDVSTGNRPVGPGPLTPSGFERFTPQARLGRQQFEALAQVILGYASPGEIGSAADALGDLAGFQRLRMAARMVLSVETVPMPLPAAASNSD